jgi:transcriptional regulator with XRE-family HTH domain
MGYRILECRKQKGMSQEELAEKASVSRAIISGLETGNIKVTTTETLLKIAKALNMKVSDIFFDD